MDLFRQELSHGVKTVAYLGPEKTNTHLAAQKKFGTQAKYLHAPTVEDVFQLVEREQADFGVVPVENSLEGTVTHTLDRFIEFKRSPAKIYGEIDLPIQHSLITLSETPKEKIRIIYSHPQALAQCRRWLSKYFPTATRRETASTAEAVEKLFNKHEIWPRDQRASIGRRELAQGKGLKAISIPMDLENRTRFLIISLEKPKRGKTNKTALLFSLKDKPGALYDALMPFKNHQVNLTRIESRPSKQKAWEYVFFIDFEGHESEVHIKKVFQELSKKVSNYLVLGSYPI